MDVEAVVLCDVLADGTVAGVALVEPIYDTNTGDRLSTRTVNPATGAAYTPVGTLQPCQPDGCNATTSALVLCDTAADGTATQFVRATTYDCEGELLGTLDRAFDGTAYTVTGTVGACPVAPDCESPTTPTATIGLCLPDGTPIAVTVVRDCQGVVTSEGWINLRTGAFSAGAPPVGTVACGDSQSVQVSGTFCDIDGAGEVVGLVLIEYAYAADGTIASVRLVDATTGATYTPTGTITTCPAGTSQPEQDLVQLCDVATDGTSTPFVRDYRRDELGAISGHSDYLLDGTDYVPTGTVGICGPELCRNSSTVLVCDVPAGSSTEITPTIVDGVLADVGQTQFQNYPGPYAGLWSGGTFIYPAGPGPAQQHLGVVGQLTADMSACEGAAGTVTISVRVRNDGPDTGQAWDGALRLFRGTTAIATHNALEWAPVGWQGTLTVSAPVTAADIAAGDLRVALILETYHLGAKQWTADQFEATFALEGCEATSSTQFLRTLVTDCVTGETVETVDTTLDGAPYTVTGTVAQCTPAETTSDCRDCEQLALCDVVDNVSTAFLRTVCRDCTGAVISTLDTALDGTTPYAVSGTVSRCCDTTVLDECTYSLPDSSTGFSFTNPAYPGCWVGVAGAPNYTFGDRVTSWEALYQSDTGSASLVRFSSPDLGGLLDFAALTPALALQPANSSPPYVGTMVVSGVTVTLTATAGDGLARWTGGGTAIALGGGDGLRIQFSEPVRLTVLTAAFADPPTTNERFCGVVAETVPWPVLRLSDCNGNVTAVDPETREPIPADAVLDCQGPGDCETAAVQVLRMCDLNPASAPNGDGLVCAVPFLRHFVYDCTGTATTYDTEMDGVTEYVPVEAVDCGESAPSLREQVWNTVSVAQDPTNPLVFTYTVANSEDPSQTGTVKMTASKAYGGGCGGTATAPVWNGPVTFVFEPDAAVLALADVLRVDAIDWDDWEDKTVSPAPSRVESDLGHVLNPGNRWHTLASNNTGHFYFDGPPTSVTMGNRNDGGGLACLAPAFGFITLVAGPPCGGVAELDHIVQPLCDTAPAGTTSFLRHWSVNNATGLLTALGDTTLDGTTGYAVTGTVSVCGQQADMPVLTGVRRLTGSTVIQTLKTEFPGLQSVSLSVLAGTVNVAMSSGSSQPIPAGASVTWSVNDNDDSSLAAASFAGASAAADYFLVWTYKGTAAG
ncbi:hypothetical protein ACFVSQ_10085 [Streptomyces niveus]|uniref:hypothetical protein n=1 Tax=Streptomyces niveus TaxID=193462 RepID=UPI0036E80960